MISLRKDGSIPSKRRGSTATGPAGFLRFARKRGSILLQQVGRYDSGGATFTSLLPFRRPNA